MAKRAADARTSQELLGCSAQCWQAGVCPLECLPGSVGKHAYPLELINVQLQTDLGSCIPFKCSPQDIAHHSMLTHSLSQISFLGLGSDI
eukprot:1138421-Pelagomonas_calceolata.AAC.2